MKIFCHRGKFGCTDVGWFFLQQKDAKGSNLKNLPPENSEESIKAAFDSGFSVEVDVTMTKDKHIIVTHTNDLSMHSPDAKLGDLVSNKTLSEIKLMRTGLGGKTSKFLTYDRLIELFTKYPELYINIEIKGTIQQKNTIEEPQNPSLVEQLAKQTPTHLVEKIIWSSFATSNLINIKKLIPNSKTAQLFYTHRHNLNPIYPNTDDKYLEFSIVNLQNVFNLIQIDAVHVPINHLPEDCLRFCFENKLSLRTWASREKSPMKNKDAYNAILNLLEVNKKFHSLNIDIITDYADEVCKIIYT